MVLFSAVPRPVNQWLNDLGGWYLVYAIIALVLIGGVAVLLRSVLGLFSSKKKPDAEAGQRENLAEYPPAPKGGPRKLTIKNVPARLRLVVLAPMGRASQL